MTKRVSAFSQVGGYVSKAAKVSPYKIRPEVPGDQIGIVQKDEIQTFGNPKTGKRLPVSPGTARQLETIMQDVDQEVERFRGSLGKLKHGGIIAALLDAEIDISFIAESPEPLPTAKYMSEYFMPRFLNNLSVSLAPIVGVQSLGDLQSRPVIEKVNQVITQMHIARVNYCQQETAQNSSGNIAMVKKQLVNYFADIIASAYTSAVIQQGGQPKMGKTEVDASNAKNGIEFFEWKKPAKATFKAFIYEPEAAKAVTVGPMVKQAIGNIDVQPGPPQPVEEIEVIDAEVVEDNNTVTTFAQEVDKEVAATAAKAGKKMPGWVWLLAAGAAGYVVSRK